MNRGTYGAEHSTFQPETQRRGDAAESLDKLFAALFRQRGVGLVTIIVVIFVVMSFTSPYFLSWANMKAMLLSFSFEGIVVVGMTILVIVGGIDLSVGSVVCLSMVVAGQLFLSGVDPCWPVWPGLRQRQRSAC